MIEILKKKIMKEYSIAADDENRSSFVEHAIMIALIEYSFKEAVNVINKQLHDGIDSAYNGNKLIFAGNRRDLLCDILINAPIDYREIDSIGRDEKTRQQIKTEKKAMARNIFSALDEIVDFKDESLHFMAPYLYMMLLNNISRHEKDFIEGGKKYLETIRQEDDLQNRKGLINTFYNQLFDYKSDKTGRKIKYSWRSKNPNQKRSIENICRITYAEMHSRLIYILKNLNRIIPDSNLTVCFMLYHRQFNCPTSVIEDLKIKTLLRCVSKFCGSLHEFEYPLDSTELSIVKLANKILKNEELCKEIYNYRYELDFYHHEILNLFSDPCFPTSVSVSYKRYYFEKLIKSNPKQRIYVSGIDAETYFNEEIIDPLELIYLYSKARQDAPISKGTGDEIEYNFKFKCVRRKIRQNQRLLL